MFTKKVKKKNRGRPPGRSAKGKQTRSLLYETAIQLFSEQGYEQTTLRQIAKEAGVSPGLLYKYYPNKVAVVLELYDQLSLTFEEAAQSMPLGPWRDRAAYALEHSMATLRPHREPLRALIPVLVGNPEHGLFSEQTAFARVRVQGVFSSAVSGANNTPQAELALALGNLLYMLQLGVILWWLLDRSPAQQATEGLIALFISLGGLASAALWLPGTTAPLLALDRLVRRGLYGEEVA